MAPRGSFASVNPSIVKDVGHGWPIWTLGRFPLDELPRDVKTAGRRAQWHALSVLAI